MKTRVFIQISILVIFSQHLACRFWFFSVIQAQIESFNILTQKRGIFISHLLEYCTYRHWQSSRISSWTGRLRKKTVVLWNSTQSYLCYVFCFWLRYFLLSSVWTIDHRASTSSTTVWQLHLSDQMYRHLLIWDWKRG